MTPEEVIAAIDAYAKEAKALALNGRNGVSIVWGKKGFRCEIAARDGGAVEYAPDSRAASIYPVYNDEVHEELQAITESVRRARLWVAAGDA